MYSSYVEKIKPTGSNQYIGLCPFHNDKTPSFAFEDVDGKHICFSSNCGVKGNASQFAEVFDISRGSIDGRVVKHPNIISKAKRNTQYDSKLLTIDERFVVDGQTGVEVNVLASEKVTLTFFVEGFLV